MKKNNTVCDNVEDYYNETISSIITQNCNGCHSGTSPSRSILTNNYNDVRSGIELIFDRVGRDKSDVGFMPLGRYKLSDEDISVLNIFLNMECE